MVRFRGFSRSRLLSLGLFGSLCVGSLGGCATMSGWFGDDHEPATHQTVAHSKLAEKSLAHEHEIRHAELEMSAPNVPPAAPEEVALTGSPRTLVDQGPREVRELTLEEAIYTALAQNKIVRTSLGTSPNNPILTNPTAAPSIYDPAIQESGVLFGRRGVEAALADFDAQFTTTMLWGRNESVQNALFGFGGPANNALGPQPGFVSQAETGTFRSALSKAFANGGRFTVAQDWDYLGTNSPGTLFPSSYTGNVRAEYRQPLWAGAGTEFTRIAGPTNPQLGNITGVSQGVMIARINTDISLADFQRNVRDMLYQVELAYWDLYLAYCLYDTSIVARNSALESWRLVDSQGDLPDPAEEPQARDRYYETRSQVETSYNNLLQAEVRLRQLLGMAVNDGTLLRPADKPATVKIEPDWVTSLAEALVNRVELRRQKWTIRSTELQLRAAHSLTNPRLDLVSSYQVAGFGDRLFASDDRATAQPFAGGVNTLTQGDLTGWTLGFEFSMPLGFRNAHSQVRNLELQLAKSRKLLAAQELEISHELARAFQNIAAQYHTAQSNFNRYIAAQEREAILQSQRAGGLDKLDLTLRAQESVAVARQNYCQSIAEYNKALASMHYFKGTLLEHYNVALAEGGWEPKAYRDAFERALERTHGIEAEGVEMKPEPFAGYSPEAAAPEAGVITTEPIADAEGNYSPFGDPEVRGTVEPRDPDGLPGVPDLPLDPDMDFDELRKRLLEDTPLDDLDETDSDQERNDDPLPLPNPLDLLDEEPENRDEATAPDFLPLPAVDLTQPGAVTPVSGEWTARRERSVERVEQPIVPAQSTPEFEPAPVVTPIEPTVPTGSDFPRPPAGGWTTRTVETTSEPVVTPPEMETPKMIIPETTTTVRPATDGWRKRQ